MGTINAAGRTYSTCSIPSGVAVLACEKILGRCCRCIVVRLAYSIFCAGVERKEGGAVFVSFFDGLAVMGGHIVGVGVDSDAWDQR